MIVTVLDQLAEQTALPPDTITQVIQILREAPAVEGRVDLDGDRLFALISTYETKTGSEWQFEGHRRYIDIQYVASGREIIGWAPSEQATVTAPYDDRSDIWFGTVPPRAVTKVPMQPDRVAVFYPSDAHAPGRAWGISVPVRKIVVKIAL